jgi:hypothetical protein
MYRSIPFIKRVVDLLSQKNNHLQHHHNNIELYIIHCLRMIQIVSQYLWMAGSFIFFLLGYIQLSSCFYFSDSLTREKVKNKGKENIDSNLSSKVFNLNTRNKFPLKHTIVAIYFGAVNLILAGGYFFIIKQSYLILATGLGLSLFYLYRSKLYWPLYARFFLFLANCFFITASVFLAISR